MPHVTVRALAVEAPPAARRPRARDIAGAPRQAVPAAVLRGRGRGDGLAPRVDTAEVDVELRAVLGGDARCADDVPRSAGPVAPADLHVVDEPVVALRGVRDLGPAGVVPV